MFFPCRTKGCEQITGLFTIVIEGMVKHIKKHRYSRTFMHGHAFRNSIESFIIFYNKTFFYRIVEPLIVCDKSLQAGRFIPIYSSGMDLKFCSRIKTPSGRESLPGRLNRQYSVQGHPDLEYLRGQTDPGAWRSETRMFCMYSPTAENSSAKCFCQGNLQTG